MPDKLKEVLEQKETHPAVSPPSSSSHDSIFFIGRNLDYAIGLEASLKLKEISYIHSEAYAAGELKHGTISLIEAGHPGHRSGYLRAAVRQGGEQHDRGAEPRRNGAGSD